VPLKLNQSLVNGGDVFDAMFSPDGSHVVFRADADFDEKYELYSVSASGGPVVKLNGTLPLGGDIDTFQFTPDGSRVVYQADGDADSVSELYEVPTAGGAVEKLNGLLVNGGDVLSFAISPNGHHVIYRADQDVDELFELYSIDLGGHVDGDFNDDGIVDAADYTVWRDGLGGKYSLDDYGVWKSHFGERAGEGAGGSGGRNGAFSAIPEPSGWVLVGSALAAVIRRGRRR